jgi:hypothetical protein
MGILFRVKSPFDGLKQRTNRTQIRLRTREKSRQLIVRCGYGGVADGKSPDKLISRSLPQVYDRLQSGCFILSSIMLSHPDDPDQSDHGLNITAKSHSAGYSMFSGAVPGNTSVMSKLLKSY